MQGVGEIKNKVTGIFELLMMLVNNRRYLKAPEVAESFGVSTRTVWNWVESGLVPHHKLGRSVFFRQEEIDSIMNRNRFLGHIRCPVSA